MAINIDPNNSKFRADEARNDLYIRSQAKAEIRENLKNLEPSDISLAEELMFLIATKRTEGSNFASHRARLLLRCRLLNEQLDRSRDQKEMIRLTAKLLDLDRLRRFCGISVDDIGNRRSSFDHKPFPISLDYLATHDVVLPPVNMPERITEYLKIDIAGDPAIDYLSYVKNIAERVAFINFNKNDMFNHYEGGGLSEPMSRTIVINHISFWGDLEEIQMPAFMLAATAVHEAAHIEYDNAHPVHGGPADDIRSERYAYIRKAEYLERLFEETPKFGLNERVRGIISTNIAQIYKELQLMNFELGYAKEDLNIY